VDHAFTTVGDLVAELGHDLLTVIGGEAFLDRPVSGVVLDDGDDPLDVHAGDLVLLPGTAELDKRIARAHAGSAAGVVVKAEVEGAGEAGLAVLQVPRGVEWGHLMRLLESAAVGGDSARSLVEGSLGRGSESVFALAELASHIIGGPVIIHDAHWRLMAYSRDQGELDQVRREAILGRGAPRAALEQLRAEGALQRLRAGEILRVSLDAVGGEERAAIAVRAGGRLLATLWIAHPPDHTDLPARLREAASVVAAGLLRQELDAGTEDLQRGQLLSALITDGTGATGLAAKLKIRGDTPVVLVGLSPEESSSLDDVRQVLEAARSYARLYRRPSAVSSSSGAVYVLSPLDGDDEVAFAQDLLGRCRQVGVQLLAAVSAPFSPLGSATRARDDVDLLVEAQRSGMLAGEVASAAADLSSLQLARLRRIAHEHPELLDGKVARLLSLPDAERLALVSTLKAWVESGGDVRKASERLVVHLNTVRYRLRRIEELVGLNLDDPTERFVTAMQVRLFL
jgi:DNA-binding PucR family transcriptional regulator